LRSSTAGTRAALPDSFFNVVQRTPRPEFTLAELETNLEGRIAQIMPVDDAMQLARAIEPHSPRSSQLELALNFAVLLRDGLRRGAIDLGLISAAHLARPEFWAMCHAFAHRMIHDLYDVHCPPMPLGEKIQVAQVLWDTGVPHLKTLSWALAVTIERDLECGPAHGVAGDVAMGVAVGADVGLGAAVPEPAAAARRTDRAAFRAFLVENYDREFAVDECLHRPQRRNIRDVLLEIERAGWVVINTGFRKHIVHSDAAAAARAMQQAERVGPGEAHADAEFRQRARESIESLGDRINSLDQILNRACMPCTPDYHARLVQALTRMQYEGFRILWRGADLVEHQPLTRGRVGTLPSVRARAEHRDDLQEQMLHERVLTQLAEAAQPGPQMPSSSSSSSSRAKRPAESDADAPPAKRANS
jgi:hypothetical protein